MTNPADLPARYLRTSEAGRFLGLSGRTLEKHRSYGTGPLYRKLGGRVVYAIADLQAWVESGVKSSTSDPNTGPAPAGPFNSPQRPKKQKKQEGKG